MRSHISTSLFSIAVIVIVISHPSGASAQKVLQCAPLKATVNNDLEVKNDLQVDRNAAIANDATVNNDLRVNKDIYGASGAQRIWLGNNTSSPYITNNAGSGILFYSQGGQNFLWQSLTNVNPDAMILKSGGGLPTNNNYNLQVFGQVSPYQLHTMGIHLDMQGGIGPVPRQNIFKITNSDNTGTGFGAAIFHGANNWQANTDDNLIFSGLTNAQDIGAIGLTMNTVSGNVGIKTVNPQITLAIGDNDTGLRWIGDGNFSVYANNSERININAATNRISIIAPNELCLGGSCISSWPSSPTITLTGDVTGSGTTSIATTIPSGTVAWSELAGIPADIVDGDQVGITSVPNCGANQKLTGSTGLPVCANDIDTDTDAQSLSIVGSDLSISGGNTITLPAASLSGSGTANKITKWTGASTLGNSTISDDGTTIAATADLSIQGNTTLGSAFAQKTTLSGNLRYSGVKVNNFSNSIVSDWKVVARDEFGDDAGVFGWEYWNGASWVQSASYSVMTSFCGNTTNRILGGYDLGTGTTQYKKLFDLTGFSSITEVKVTAKFYSIDSWDGEQASLAIIMSDNAGNYVSGDRGVWIERLWGDDIGRTQLCGLNIGFIDGIYHAEATAHLNTLQKYITVFVDTSLNQGGADESFGIDDVEVWVR